jgi:hypothetical protein
MADNRDSKDRSLETLDFIINVLREHEMNLDKTSNELSSVVEQISEAVVGLKVKVDGAEEKISNLQEEVTTLISNLSNAPKKELTAEVKQPAPQSAASTAVIQGERTLILRCSQWSDFQDLAIHAQRLSFSYKEDEKVFQANAFMGNQMIIYVGDLPDFSVILKKWLSRQLDISEQDILEGFLDKPK